MKKQNKFQKWMRLTAGALAAAAVLATGFGMNTITSLADSAGKITTPSSAKVRKEPSTSSESVGSAANGEAVSVVGQITADDGKVWYKVKLSGGTVGYIRADLMEITDGSTPPTVVGSTAGNSSGTSTPTTSTPDEALVDVALVEPVSAKVSSSSPVRVRQNASTTSRIVSNANKDLELTVIGQATGKDNKQWYQVSFIYNGSEVNGFIRADYVKVNGDLVPKGSQPAEPVENTGDAPKEPTQEEAPAEKQKDWETYYDTKWHLIDNTTGNSYDIAQIFSSVEANTQTLQDKLKENKTQQIIIVILVIVIILLGTVISFLFFKLRDMADSAYFNEVEKETLRNRTADRPVNRPGNGQRTMRSVEGKPAQGRPAGNRPEGARPAGSRPEGARPAQNRPEGARPAGSRPEGARPAGSRPEGARPAQNRPEGARPAGSRPEGARPAQNRPEGARPAGSRPEGARPAQNRPEGARPAGNRPEGARPAGSRPEGARPAQPVPAELKSSEADFAPEEITFHEEPVKKPEHTSKPWKSRNFTDEDDLEFQFIDWDDK